MNKYYLFLITYILIFSNDSQAQWQSDVRLTNDPATSKAAANNTRYIASSGDYVHVVWHDNRNGNFEIYYKRSTDGGLSWGADTRLTSTTGDSYVPSVSLSGSAVHVVWEGNSDGNYGIYYKRSNDGGITWETNKRLSNNSAVSRNPSLSISGSVVHVVWDDNRNGNWDIYYKRSADGGLNWSVDTRLTNLSSVTYPLASISALGTVVHVVWLNNQEIFYKHSTDGGSNWSIDTRLTNDPAFSGYSSVALSGTAVHVVWFDTRDGNAEIYYKRSTDGGLSWGADTRLSNSIDSRYPSISVFGSVVHIVWNDNSNRKNDIYYKRSTDGGSSWETDRRLTNNSDSTWLPSIAVSGIAVHIVWPDKRNGNWEIYYKRNPTGNPIEIINSDSQTLSDAQKAYNEGKYALVIEMLKDFPESSSLYDDALALMLKALSNIQSGSSQNFSTVYGRITNPQNINISGYIIFEDFITGSQVGKCKIGSNGYYCIILPSGKRYSYYIDATGFYPLSRIADFTSPKQGLNLNDNISLVSLEQMSEEQLSIRINNIFFDFNQSVLKPESFPELDRLYNVLNANSDMKVEISGHTDNVGSDDYNNKLSQSRAEAVKDYLVKKGIKGNRIISKGYGKSNPVSTNDTEEGRQLNRRVEFKILKK